MSLQVKKGSQIYNLRVASLGNSALKVRRNGVTYDVCLVDPGDSSASPVRVKTSAGIKAIQLQQPTQFSDNFNDNVLNTLYWQQLQAGSASCSESGQQLQVSATGGQNWSQAGYVTANSYSMDNKTASVTVTNQNGVAEMELFVIPSKVTTSDPCGEPNFYRIIHTSSNSVNVQRNLNFNFVTLTSVYSPNPVTLSVAVQNGQIRFYIGATQIYSESYQLSTYDCYIYIVTSSNATGTGAFDNFSIIPIGQPQQFTITASAGTGGSISPSGQVYVNQGSTPTFTITPNSGYRVSAVSVNGSPAGRVTSYTFPSVQTDNQTIAATFELIPPNTITRVQGNKRGITSGSSLTMTLDSTPTNGNKLIAAIGTYGSYPPYVASISQTGVSWSQQAVSSDWSLYGRRVEIWAGVVSSGASATLTITLGDSGSGPSADPVIADICEYNGLATSNFLDRTATASGIYTTTLTTGSTSTTQADELWVGAIFNVCNQGGGQSDSNPLYEFTQLDGIGSVYAQTKSLAYLENIVNAMGTASSGVTGGSYVTYEAYVGCIATFKSATTGTTYTITASAGTGGSINPLGTTTVNSGNNQAYSIEVNTGYSISNVTVDGASQGAISSYTFSNVQANHTIAVTFQETSTTCVIAASANNGGTISPPGTTVVLRGDSLTYTITPTIGYTIANVWVDSISQGAISSYTFSNVQANHMIVVNFSPLYAITSAAGTGGTISPSGTTLVAQGGSQTYTITPNTGYSILTVFVNGNYQGPISTYTFTNVQASQTIQATFTT